MRVTPAIKPMLESQRLGARPYSVSALQKFATCPYQFVLSAIYRFAPNDPPEPLQRLDPLTRGSLFHEVQARVLRALHAGQAAAADARRRAACARRRSIGARRRPPPRTRSVWRPRSSACGATRSPRSAATCASGSASCRIGAVDAGVLRVQLRPRRRGPRRAQPARAGADRRPLHPARLGRRDRDESRARRSCASPTTRPAATARRRGR